MKYFITALQFLTIVTVNKKHEIREGDLAKSMAHFPLVGFLIGFVLINADKAFDLLVLPRVVGNFILVMLMVVMTRALHVDGLADTLDGLMGGNNRNARLAIMKDSRIGTAGVLGILFALLMKYICLNNIHNPINLIASEKAEALLVAPMLARWSQAIMVYKGNYGREDGMGKAFVGHLRASSFAYASATAIGLSAFVVMRTELKTIVLFFCLTIGVVLLTLLARRYLEQKLGGVTGDAIGAVNELNEVLVLLLFVVFSNGN
jgi:adenosylcobinamide-GDP ribazoletransferase